MCSWEMVEWEKEADDPCCLMTCVYPCIPGLCSLIGTEHQIS